MKVLVIEDWERFEKLIEDLNKSTNKSLRLETILSSISEHELKDVVRFEAEVKSPHDLVYPTETAELLRKHFKSGEPVIVLVAKKET